MENEKYLSEQLITYLGNKRTLLSFIGESVNDIKLELDLEKLSFFDGFAGSGIVSRFFKQHASKIYSNDLEKYSYLVTKAYLTNQSEIDFSELKNCLDFLNMNKLDSGQDVGIIEKLYAPKNTFSPKRGERCFYTNENAKIIDNLRRMIFDLNPVCHDLFLANLLHKASVHTNTSGVFKGFYKSKTTGIGKFGGEGENALVRIMGEISLELPVLSNYECEYEVFQDDVMNVVSGLPRVNVAYYDPPYNQHPYSSNYHVLNTIFEYSEPRNISDVAGIRTDWNKSDYNYKSKASQSLDALIRHTNADFILLSYNNEGIIPENEIVNILSKYGVLEIRTQEYPAFKGSRNLSQRSVKVKEYLYVLKKF
jgi:adenine-specific DNA-methyltransferase